MLVIELIEAIFAIQFDLKHKYCMLNMCSYVIWCKTQISLKNISSYLKALQNYF